MEDMRTVIAACLAFCGTAIFGQQAVSPEYGLYPTSITSKPPGAKVFIEEMNWGSTPVTFRVQPKEYKVRLSLVGFEDWKGVIVVAPQNENRTVIVMRRREAFQTAAVANLTEVSLQGAAPLKESARAEHRSDVDKPAEDREQSRELGSGNKEATNTTKPANGK
jgi:hypothetical protein